MKAVLYILFGVGFTATVSLALGMVLFSKLSLKLKQGEEQLLAFITGSAVLSAIVFALSTVKLARKGIFLAVGAVAILAAFRLGAHRPAAEALPPLPRRWYWTMLAAFGAFTCLYFFHAMTPDVSPDGTAYHLTFPAAYYRAHGFVRIPWNMYANLTQGIELLFLFAFAFGKYSAATMVHFSFFLALPWLMVCWGRRFGFPAAATAGALFVFASPVVGIDGTSAYVDVALAAILFALFYLLQIWDQERDARLLIPIGILAGFSFAVKYTAFLAVPYALGFVWWKLRRTRQPWVRSAATVSGIALIFMLPWLIKNWLWMGNPVIPFANALFPNPYVHISFEEEYRKNLQIYGLTSYRQLPWELTVSGVILSGLLGPLFLLTPLALLALRKPAGRAVLLAGFVFSLPYLTNIGTRFLIPALPFLSIALAMAAASWDWILLGFVFSHAIASWPSVVNLYCAPSAWRFDTKDHIRPALRLEAEDTYLSRTFEGYAYDRLLEKLVPPDGIVLSYNQVAEAYTTRQIRVNFLSGPNQVLGDIVWTPLFEEFQPRITVDYRFPSRTVRKIRVVKTGDRLNVQWGITEVRLSNAGAELPRDPGWRLTAKPNPWDVQLAFDNSPVTRWRSWENVRPGMYVEIDFAKPQPVDLVRIETQTDWREPDMRIDGLDDSGKWTPLSTQGDRKLVPIKVNLRLAATRELKARGIRYLLVGLDDIGSEDFQQRAAFWGIKFLAEAGSERLYYIE